MTGKKNVPNLRFKEFSDEWEEKRLGEICEIVSGGTPSTDVEDYWNGDINWITPSDMSSNKYVYSSATKISKEGIKNSSSKINPSGSIVLITKTRVGELSILNYPSATNQNLETLIPLGEVVSDFVYYSGRLIKKYCKKKACGSTFLTINKRTLSKMKLYIPSLPEQQKIGTFLSSLDNLIGKQEEKVRLLENEKKGLMQKIFSQEIRFKDDDGNDYPDWEEKRLGDVLEEYTERNNKLYQAVAVGRYGIRKREDIYSKELSKDISNNKVIRLNTLTIGMGSTQIDIGVLNEDKAYCVSPAYHTFKIQNTNGIFLENYFNVKNKYLSNLYMITGARQGKSIEKKGFLNHNDKFPSLEEQEKIANFLSAFDQLIEKEKQLLADQKALKQGLLQQMFV